MEAPEGTNRDWLYQHAVNDALRPWMDRRALTKRQRDMLPLLKEIMEWCEGRTEECLPDGVSVSFPCPNGLSLDMWVSYNGDKEAYLGHSMLHWNRNGRQCTVNAWGDQETLGWLYDTKDDEREAKYPTHMYTIDDRSGTLPWSDLYAFLADWRRLKREIMEKAPSVDDIEV